MLDAPKPLGPCDPSGGYGRAVLRAVDAAAQPPCPEEHAIAILADALPAIPSRLPERLSTPPGRAQRWALVALLLWLLVGPRVELPVAGLRVEDLVLAALGLICLLHVRSLGRPGGLLLAVLGVGATGVLAAAVGSARGMVDPVTAALYALRPLEYAIAFPATLLLVRSANGAWRQRAETVLVVTTVLQAAFAVLQYYFQIPLGFSHAAYTRAAGLTVGPYELGAISAALSVYWVSRARWVLASLSVVALAASISRISILGAAVALTVLAGFWAARQTRRIRRHGWRTAFSPYRRSRFDAAVQLLAVGAAGLVLAFTLGLITPPASSTPPAGPAAAPSVPAAPEQEDGRGNTPSTTATPEPTSSATREADVPPDLPSAPSESVTTRLADTSVLGSWSIAGVVAATIPHVDTAVEYADVAYAHINDHINAGNLVASGAEPSNLVRFFRWHLILNTIDDPADVIFGLGPSFVGPSVDGSYLRFFADSGLLGVIAWLALVVMWLRRTPLWMVCITVSLLVGALFIDILYAERPMVLYWLLLALAVAVRAPRAVAADPRSQEELVDPGAATRMSARA